MDTTIDTASTDLVVLDDVTANDDSDTEGTTNVALIGSAAFAAGVAVGTVVVPKIVGFVRGWFTSSDTDVAAEVAQIMATTENSTEEKAV